LRTVAKDLLYQESLLKNSSTNTKTPLKTLGSPRLHAYSPYQILIPQIGYPPLPPSLVATIIVNSLSYLRWMFEKYDGVRGFWNPIRKAFYSRRGRKLTLPQEILDKMPSGDVFLDGELWYVQFHTNRNNNHLPHFTGLEGITSRNR